MNAHLDNQFRIAPAAPAQPGTQVLPQYKLLYTGYDYMGVLLDLYGDEDEDGIEVCDVALVGDKRSLGELFSRKALADMSHFVERRIEEAVRDSAGQAAIDRVEHARMMDRSAA